MIENFSNDGSFFDCGNDSHFSLACGAQGDVDVEDALKKSCPTDPTLT